MRYESKTKSDLIKELKSLRRKIDAQTKESLKRNGKSAKDIAKKAVDSLIESQHMAHIGNWELNLTTNALSWSEEIYHIFEIDPKKFGASYEAFLEAIHPNDREFVNNAYTYSINNKSPYSIDHRLLFADGRIKFVHEECQTFYDKHNKPIRSVGTVQDITERKTYEQALLTSSLYTRGLIEASLDPLVTISQDGVITDVNHATEIVTGHDREKLIGKDFSDYFTEPDKAREGYKKVLKEGTVKDYPLQIRHTTGKITDVLYNATVYKNQKGELQGIFAAARDITEQKKTEELIRLKNEYNRRLIEASLDPLVTIGPDGKITDVNSSTERITGLKREKLIGTDFSNYFTEPGKAKAGYLEVFQNGFVRDYPLEIRQKNGKIFSVLYNASLYKDERGRVVGVFAAARDITAKKKAEETLRERERHSQSLLRLSKKFELSITYADVLNAAQTEVQSSLGYKSLWVYLLSDDKKYFKALVAGGPMSNTILSEEGTATLTIAGDSMLEEIADAREIIVVEDASKDARTNKEIVRKLGNHTIVNVPIFLFDKRLGSLGTGTFGEEGVRVPTKLEEEFLVAMASHLAVALDRIHLLNERRIHEEKLIEAQRIGRYGNWDWDAVNDTIMWSEEYYKIYGLDSKSAPPSYTEHLKIYTRESAAALELAVNRSMQTGKPYELDLEFMLDNGKRRWVTARGECKFDSNGKVVGLRGTAQDITERKLQEKAIASLNRVYKVLSETNQLIIHEKDRKHLLEGLCHIAVEDGKLLMASVSFVDYEARKVTPFVWYGKEEGYLSEITITIDDTPEGRGPTGRAIRENRYVFSTDIASESIMQPWKERALKRGYRSSASFPLSINNEVIGVFTVYAGEPAFFNEHELSLLNELAMDISYALQNLGMEESRKLTMDALLESEEKFRQLASSAQDSIVIMDGKGKFFYWNKSFEKLFDYTSDEIEGKEVHATIVPPRYYQDYVKGVARYKETGEGCAIGKTMELYAIKKDAKEFPVELSVSTFMFKGERMALGILRDISERKRIENEVAKRSRLLEALFTNHMTCFVILDKDFNFIRVNEAYARACARPVSDFPGHNHFEFYPSDARPIFEEVVRSKKPFQVAARPFVFEDHPDWGITYWDWTLVPIIDSNGEVEFLVFSLNDVTERVTAEQELQTSSGQLKQVFDNIDAVVFSLDLVQGKLLKISKACEKVYGFKQEMFFENPRIWMTLIHPEDLPEVQTNWQLLLAHKKSSSEVEYRIVRHDGEIRWIRNESKSIADETGRAIRLDGISYDITERRKAEKEIRRLSEAVEQSPVSVVIADLEAKIEYVNKAFEETTGYTFAEVIHQNPKIIQSGLTPKETYKDFWDTIKSGRIWKGEFLNKRKNGELFWENEIITPILDKNNRVINYLAIKQDITEKKEMTEELIKAKDRAEKSDRLKTEFLQQMSHEIRSPMNVTISLSNLIKDEVCNKVDPEVLEYFEGIDMAGKRLIRTVDLILNTSEMYVGTYEPTFTEVDIFEEALKHLKLEFHSFANKKGLEFVLSSNVSEPRVTCDKYSVSQVLGNLIDNAIKYTHEGKVEIIVDQNSDNNVLVTVADTGIGISKEFMEKLFEPFTQEERGYSRRYEGNGLGLALVKKYCDLNNAIIEVESEKGRGSKFTVTFLNSRCKQ